jgi:hypothetical protein
METQKPQIAKTVLSKKRNGGGITTPTSNDTTEP